MIERETKSFVRRSMLPLCVLLFGVSVTGDSMAAVGAEVPWTSHEAESMETNGALIGPGYSANTIEVESSSQRAVRLEGAGSYVEFAAENDATGLVMRFNLPDAPSGGGLETAMELLVNGERVRTLELSSKYMWLYGSYPFTNNPAHGITRNFYDEVRVKDLVIDKGDIVRIQKVEPDGVYCVVDLVDLEIVPAAIQRPDDSLSVLDFGAAGDGQADDTQALIDCLAAAREQGKVAFVPEGNYKITRDVRLYSDVTLQGAGMWYTNFVGDEGVYAQWDRRVRFKLDGSNIRLSDFSIMGALNYRQDNEESDGIVSDGCSQVEISNIWIEHTKVGVWVNNANELTVRDCRFRNLLADGTNFCVSTSNSVVDNCTARGTGDDCFAMWPAVFDTRFLSKGFVPGNNTIKNCTGSVPFLANGAAIYGGAGNRVENCLFTDVGTGCGILISTTFPTAIPSQGIDHNFSGKTYIENVKLVRCGGYDHVWQWRGSMQVCMDRRNITGLTVDGIEILDSLSYGFTVVGPGEGALSDSFVSGLRISNSDLAELGHRGFFVGSDAEGVLRVSDSSLELLEVKADGFVVEQSVALDFAPLDSSDRFVLTPKLGDLKELYFELSEDLRSWDRITKTSKNEQSIDIALTSDVSRRFFRAWERFGKD